MCLFFFLNECGLATAADEITEANVGIENLPRSPKNKASELRRSIVFRGKNMTIERVCFNAEIIIAISRHGLRMT